MLIDNIFKGIYCDKMYNKKEEQIMLDKIKALPDKTLLMIGITLQFIAMTFISCRFR